MDFNGLIIKEECVSFELFPYLEVLHQLLWGKYCDVSKTQERFALLWSGCILVLGTGSQIPQLQTWSQSWVLFDQQRIEKLLNI